MSIYDETFSIWFNFQNDMSDSKLMNKKVIIIERLRVIQATESFVTNNIITNSSTYRWKRWRYGARVTKMYRTLPKQGKDI